MILRFILWWISRPRSLYETLAVYWKVRDRMLLSFPYMRNELNEELPRLKAIYSAPGQPGYAVLPKHPQ